MDTIRPNWNVLLVSLILVAALTALAAGLTAGLSSPERPPARPTGIVHAEQSGLRLGLQALAGRVALVSSTAGLRWRIAGETSWRRAAGPVLVRGFDTTRLSDGPYLLELGGGRGLMIRPSSSATTRR
jgi:hypothetical protein